MIPNNNTGKWRYTEDQRDRAEECIKRIFTMAPPQTPEELTTALQHVCHLSLEKKYPRTRREGKRWWSQKIDTLRKSVITAKRRITRANKKQDANAGPLLQAYSEAYSAFKAEKDASKKRLHNRLCEELDHNPWGDAYRTAISKLRPRHKSSTPPNAAKVIATLFPTHPPVDFKAQSSEDFQDFTEDEIVNAAKRLKSGKSPGPDGVPPEITRLAALLAPGVYKNIMNRLAAEGSFPAIWKEAALKLIPKEGHSDLTPKYRPICLISTTGKLYEHLLNQRLNADLVRTKGLSELQHAFIPRRSCATALESAIRFIERSRKRGPKWVPTMVLLDVTNAFNCANWQTILNRLRRTGTKEYLIRLIKSYLSERTLDFEGQIFTLTSGVPQGSVLGPTLWNVLIDSVTRIQLPDYCQMVVYADDIAILIEAQDSKTMTHRANLAIKRITTELSSLGLKVAPNKCDALIVSGQRTSIDQGTHFTLGNQTIRPSPTVKYLGITFDSNMNFCSHATRVCSAATAALNALGAILSAENVRMARRRVIARVVEAKLTYACEVWAHRISTAALERLECVQKRAAVRITRGMTNMNGEAALVLAGMLPIAIVARTRRAAFIGQGKATARDLGDMWQNRWKDYSCWTRTMIPDVRVWITRKHGEVGSALTEVLSGQGHFGTYLKTIKKRPSSNCRHCHCPETLRHLLMNCPRFDRERTAAGLQGECDLRTVTRTMLGSQQGWRRVERLAARIREEGLK